MAKSIKTHLYCLDSQRAFTGEILKKFPDVSRYTVLSFQDIEEYIQVIEEEKEYKFCKIAVIGLNGSAEQYEEIDHLTIRIKELDPKAGIILLFPGDKIDDIKRAVKFNIDAYIPRNTNFILRVHNTVKKHISEYNIGIFRRRRNISLVILTAFILLSAIFLVFSYFRFPEYF